MAAEVDNLFQQEMGFSAVIEALIAAKKPIVGHNMIYDIIYLYNQFIDDLPDTYNEFVLKWHQMFPYVYDNKVLSSAADYFGRTDLGKVYEKCLNDERIKNSGIKIAFDLDNNFKNYDGSELLSHYHEAAYDAFMTGVCFANILKFKEHDKGKPAQASTAKKGTKDAKEEDKKEEEAKVEAKSPPRINFEH